MNPFTHHYPVAFDPKTPMTAQSTRHEQLVGHLHRTMPTTIARLEKAYPGATYAGLGRDVVVMSDALDAYYGSIGQQGRAARVNASTASFHHASHEDTYDLVRHSTGLDLDHVHESGFVLYDNTRYAETSQSHKVMAALYSALHALGKSSADYAGTLSVASISEGYPTKLPGTAAAADAFLASHLASERLQMGPGALGPVHALQISGIGYGLEWHGSFGPMTRTGSGVTTQPGAVANLETRESILWEAHEMLRVTESPEFRASVEREAQLLGMKAPHHNAGN